VAPDIALPVSALLDMALPDIALPGTLPASALGVLLALAAELRDGVPAEVAPPAPVLPFREAWLPEV
jgi:hypothetical protein